MIKIIEAEDISNILRACPKRKQLRDWIRQKCKVESPEAEIRIRVNGELYPIAGYIDDPGCYEPPEMKPHVVYLKRAAELPEVSSGWSWKHSEDSP